MSATDGIVLAFDVGERRIGVARAAQPPGIAAPWGTLQQSDSLRHDLEELLRQEQPVALVVGRPRNQQGEKTGQTRSVARWTRTYLLPRGIATYWQDESLTSKRAEDYLERTKPRYQKADIDAAAAMIILTDFIESHQRKEPVV